MKPQSENLKNIYIVLPPLGLNYVIWLLSYPSVRWCSTGLTGPGGRRGHRTNQNVKYQIFFPRGGRGGEWVVGGRSGSESKGK